MIRLTTSNTCKAAASGISVHGASVQLTRIGPTIRFADRRLTLLHLAPRAIFGRRSPGVLLKGLLDGDLPLCVGVDRSREFGGRGVVTGERDDQPAARLSFLSELIGDGESPTPA
jgi:hypothetical protein